VRPFRRFASARQRFAAVWADMPVVFFAVVVGVALTFRVAIGWARGEREAEPAVEPAFAAAAPAASHARAPAAPRFEPDPAAGPLPAQPARRSRPKSSFPRHGRAH
jgi:hypothetical protein